MKQLSIMVCWACVMMFIGNAAYGEIPEVFKQPIRIVLITEFGDALPSYIKGTQEEAESLGFQLEVLDAKHDQDRMVELFDDAVFRNVDGIIISHGSVEKLSSGLRRAIRRKIPVVATWHNAEALPEIPEIHYDDYQMAELILNRIREDNPEACNSMIQFLR